MPLSGHHRLAAGRLPKGEDIGANTGVEELDLEGAILHRPGLPDQLVEARLLNLPATFQNPDRPQ